MVVPVYIAEVAPTSIRGIMLTTNNLCTNTGQFLAYLVCLAFIPNWRLMLGIPAVIALIQMVLMTFMCESPRWLIKN